MMTPTTLSRLVVASAVVLASSVALAQSSKTRIGKLDVDGGYPTKKTVERLHDHLDFQRAVQAYLWALPWAGFGHWQAQHTDRFGAGEGDVVRYDGYRDKFGLLTADPTAPVFVGFHDLERSGPLVIEFPADDSRGGIADAWQRPLVEIEPGVSYAVIGPGQDFDGAGDHTVVRSPTHNIVHWSGVVDDGTSRVIDPEDAAWSAAPPGGMAYWKLVARLLDEEPIEDRDRSIVSALNSLGLMAGKPFTPDEYQTETLEEAVVVGEAMARFLAYAERREGDEAFPETQWLRPVLPSTGRESEDGSALDERAAWFFLASRPGAGGAFVRAHRSKSGRWLSGENSYRLRIPAGVPADGVWSVTAYDAETRGFIDNEQEIDGLDSTMDLFENEDGSISLYFGPEPPDDEDKHHNWIPTRPNRGWFVFVRFAASTRALFDGSWQLPDIVMTASDDDRFGGGG